MQKRVIAQTRKLLEPGLQLVLVVLFLVQTTILVCLLTYGYIPLPAQWANRQLLQKPFNEFYIQAESFRLKFNGEIELIDIEVYSSETPEPILKAACTVMQYGFNIIGRFQFNLNKLIVTDGTLLIPAIYAPNGKQTAILERVTFHLKPTEQSIQIDSFAGKHEDIYLRGSIEWPIRSGGKSRIPPIRQLYELSAFALREKARFSPFIEPTLEFSLSRQWDESVDVSLRLSSEELKYDRAVGTYFTFNTAFRLHGKSLIAQAPLLLFAQKITFPDMNLCAEELSAQIAVDRWPELLKGTLSEFEISAYRLTTNKIELDSPTIRIYPENFPELQFSGSTSGLNGGVAFSGQFDVARQSGQIFASGSLDLSSLISETVFRKLPQLEFYSNPFYDISLTLEEGLVPNCATFRMNASKVIANGVHFDHLLAKGSYGKDGIQLNRIIIDRENQWVDGTFRLDTSTDDFEITLNGLILPREYGILLPEWWDNIFEDLNFVSEAPVFGDFVIYGNTSKKGKNFFFGQAKASNFVYRNADIDACQLIVRGRKNYVELYRLEVSSGSGWANGNVGFTLAPKPKKGLLSIRYNFDALISAKVASTILGGEIATTIDSFELTAFPRVKVKGVFFDKKHAQYEGKSAIYLEADVQAPLAFKKVPLQYLNFKLYGRENNIFLRDVDFGYADGAANAIIDILGFEDKGDEQVCFQLNLQDANHAKALENLPDFGSSNSSRSAMDKQARSGGLLDLKLHAKGPLTQIYEFNGYGNLEIYNDALGSIQLLGPLSEWLKNTRINFTSFNLNHVDAVFEIDHEQIIIDELVINGPRTRIWADGTFQLPSQALKMGVRVSLFANAGRPDSPMNAFGKFIAAPFPNLLVFNLTGTVNDQKIRSQFDPRNLVPGL